MDNHFSVIFFLKQNCSNKFLKCDDLLRYHDDKLNICILDCQTKLDN